MTSSERSIFARTRWYQGKRLTVIGSRQDAGRKVDRTHEWATIGTRRQVHRHARFDELIQVASGELTVRAGTRSEVLRAGGLVTIPAGTAHALVETGPGPTWSLVLAPWDATPGTDWPQIKHAQIAMV